MSLDDTPEGALGLADHTPPVRLEVRDLRVKYRVKGEDLHAVDGVSFTVDPGQSMGLVGESGCGKTTVLKAILRLLPSTAISEGQVLLDEEDILTMSSKRLREVRWTKLSLITQSAMNALDPVYTVGDQIVESITAHVAVDKGAAWKRAEHLFDLVGISTDRMKDYPHQLSGGMRQRVVIAMALSLNAGLLLADEPTTALDSLMQDQILGRIKGLQTALDRSMILVTHDIAVVAESCDRIVVMYAGRVVEAGPTEDLLLNPFHPYTVGLRNAFPTMDDREDRELVAIPGNVPGLINPPTGCRFASRCPFRTDHCVNVDPPLVEVGKGHLAACHYPDQAERFRSEAAHRSTWDSIGTLNAEAGLEL